MVSLQRPDFQLLQWSSSDKARYSLPARTLATAMKEGHDLYPELQRTYLKNSTDVNEGVNGVPELMMNKVTVIVDQSN